MLLLLSMSMGKKKNLRSAQCSRLFQFFVFTCWLVYSKRAEMYIELWFKRRLGDVTGASEIKNQPEW
jgi:hypothetical protein